MSDVQYRARSNGANLRTDPSLDASIVTTVRAGFVLHLDPDRATDIDKDGHHWIPVVVVNGWVRDDTVEPVKTTA